MQFKNMMLLGAMASLAMVSCSKNESLAEGGPETDGVQGDKAYMSLSIEMPNVAGSRAIGGGTNGSEAGENYEQKISELSVYIWDKGEETATATAHYFTADKLTPGGFNSNHNVSYYTTSPIEVTKGDKKVVVIVNGGQTAINGLAKLHEAYTVTGDNGVARREAVKKFSENNKFLMTNACDVLTQDSKGSDLASTENKKDGEFYADGSVAVNVTGNKTTPTTVVVPVERVVAKIVEITETISPDIDDKSGDKVHFEAFALVNGNTTFYPIKHVRAQVAENIPSGQQPDVNNDYIVDPNFDGTPTLKDPQFYANDFTKTAEFEWISMTAKAPVYPLENTMVAAKQYNAYTTGVYYKAVYEKKGVTKGTHLFKFAGKLMTFEELEASGDVTLVDPDSKEAITKESSIEVFKKIGVKKYENGVCYYPYWIRHISRSEVDLAPMEFGVVRNNCYKLNITKVKGIGENVPVDPQPEKPDEVDGLLEVIVKVMPWTVRQNDIEL